MNYFREYILKSVLDNEVTARYFLLEMTLRGVKLDCPISQLTHEQVKQLSYLIYDSLEDNPEKLRRVECDN